MQKSIPKRMSLRLFFKNIKHLRRKDYLLSKLSTLNYNTRSSYLSACQQGRTTVFQGMCENLRFSGVMLLHYRKFCRIQNLHHINYNTRSSYLSACQQGRTTVFQGMCENLRFSGVMLLHYRKFCILQNLHHINYTTHP